ncbi:MAG: L-aspartate oxidase [Clostridia bacterium]|nr:L-aspartate oxidase [Clostridia bacterium]
MFPYKIEADEAPFDVIVIGSGLAGVYTALNLDEKSRVLLVCKKSLLNSNSSLAQGGIAAVLSKEDSYDLHVADTMKTGHYENDEMMVRCLVENGPKEISQLLAWQVPFDLEGGELCLAREGAHSVRRIARCGDHTGRTVMETLIEKIQDRANITVLEYTTVTDILMTGDRVSGVGCINDNKIAAYKSRRVVLATGGVGQLFRHTTNDETITGDGFSLAQKAGLTLERMDAVQFHPTALFERGTSSKRFLISEAVRGEGAVLRDYEGHEFMTGIHEMGSLAPRDIVTGAINRLLLAQEKAHVFLDATTMTKDFFSKRFPTIYQYCSSIGIDVTQDYVPVVPCAHYLMGGIPVDDFGRTALEGLYACGEVAYTNVHGANRLASNSLLECLVFGKRVAEAINKEL